VVIAASANLISLSANDAVTNVKRCAPAAEQQAQQQSEVVKMFSQLLGQNSKPSLSTAGAGTSPAASNSGFEVRRVSKAAVVREDHE
jgi:methylphosphotriester-DNA--protein-cysteine methyltransferase